MNIEELRAYCLSKKKSTEDFPFDQDVLVFKVCNKMFALTSLKSWEEGAAYVNLKCDPDEALRLRTQYKSVQPGYHMSKKHWNTIVIGEDIKKEQLQKWIDDSYQLIVSKLPGKLQKELETNEI